MSSETKTVAARQLQVGDVIYRCGNYGISDRYTIDRVSPKRAFIDRMQFERMPDKYGRLKRISALYSSYSFYIETPERAEQWERQELLQNAEKAVKAISAGKLTNDQLLRIIAIIEEKPVPAPDEQRVNQTT